MSIIELNPRQPAPSRDPESIDWNQLLRTMTGEPLQLIRLYGTIHKTSIWQGRFRRLKSIQPVAGNDRWQWLYTHEAKTISLPLASQEIPKPYRPAVLATMTKRGQELMIEVRSMERAIALASFLMDKLKPQVFELTRVRVVNQFFNVSEATDPPTDDADDRPDELRFKLDIEALFNPPDLQLLSDQAFEEKVKQITAEFTDEAERMEAVNTFLEAESQRPTPKAEELPFHGYDEGIEHLMLMLQMRQVVTFEHWQGNTSFTQLDAIDMIMQGAEELE